MMNLYWLVNHFADDILQFQAVWDSSLTRRYVTSANNMSKVRRQFLLYLPFFSIYMLLVEMLSIYIFFFYLHCCKLNAFFLLSFRRVYLELSVSYSIYGYLSIFMVYLWRFQLTRLVIVNFLRRFHIYLKKKKIEGNRPFFSVNFLEVMRIIYWSYC